MQEKFEKIFWTLWEVWEAIKIRGKQIKIIPYFKPTTLEMVIHKTSPEIGLEARNKVQKS